MERSAMGTTPEAWSWGHGEASKLPTLTSSDRPGAYELPLDFLTDPPSKALSS
jgi:hypothetical protein